ncbi:MAG: hypothetical protein Q4G09_02395 [Clostridia bacterium]|nr:hypothetical protein [Clostridia bacterium]
MERDLRKLSSKELIELYNINKVFLSFLNKEIKNAEKMRDENE